MKILIFIATIAVIGWYGNVLYKQHSLPFAQNSSTNCASKALVKCITKDGSVLYGSVPPGTICERTEPVKGSLTIVPSETFGHHNDDGGK